MQSLLTIEEDGIFSTTFSKLIHSSSPICTKDVAATIKRQPKLCHLLKKFTARQWADKVHSMRKATVRVNEEENVGKIGNDLRSWNELSSIKQL